MTSLQQRWRSCDFHIDRILSLLRLLPRPGALRRLQQHWRSCAFQIERNLGLLRLLPRPGALRRGCHMTSLQPHWWSCAFHNGRSLSLLRLQRRQWKLQRWLRLGGLQLHWRIFLHELPVAAEEFPHSAALVRVAPPREHSDVQLLELARAERLHCQGYAFRDALPWVVENTAAEGHQEHLGSARPRPFGGYSQRAEIVCDKHSLRDANLESTIVPCIQIGIHWYRGRVN